VIHCIEPKALTDPRYKIVKVAPDKPPRQRKKPGPKKGTPMPKKKGPPMNKPTVMNESMGNLILEMMK
jgi:hypothetical protein